MISTQGATFTTLLGTGTVRIIDGDPWVEWDEGGLAPSLHRCRVRSSESTRAGIRWECYLPGDGHNRTQTVPTRCIEAAYEKEGDYVND